jgi:hypothetical protein
VDDRLSMALPDEERAREYRLVRQKVEAESGA